MARNVDVTTTQADPTGSPATNPATNPAASITAASNIDEHDLAWVVSRRDRCDSETNVFDKEACHRVEIGTRQHGFNRRGPRDGLHDARSTSTSPARRNEPSLSTIVQ